MPSINPQAVRGPVTAVPVVAGKGVRFVEDIENNRVVAEADETVLFEDTSSTGTLAADVVLSESSVHFSKLEITLGWAGGGSSPLAGRLVCTCVPDGKRYGFAGYIGNDAAVHYILGGIYTNGTSLTIPACLDMYTTNNSSVTYQTFKNTIKVYKVVGVNRVASA